MNMFQTNQLPFGCLSFNLSTFVAVLSSSTTFTPITARQKTSSPNPSKRPCEPQHPHFFSDSQQPSISLSAFTCLVAIFTYGSLSVGFSPRFQTVGGMGGIWRGFLLTNLRRWECSVSRLASPPSMPLPGVAA